MKLSPAIFCNTEARCEDHEELIIRIRKDIDESVGKSKDAGTIDFLTGIMEQHETTAWILRRYLN
jgi:starvation-inducible DNA-binding protein